jgi:hypothetical protein
MTLFSGTNEHPISRRKGQTPGCSADRCISPCDRAIRAAGREIHSCTGSLVGCVALIPWSVLPRAGRRDPPCWGTMHTRGSIVHPGIRMNGKERGYPVPEGRIPPAVSAGRKEKGLLVLYILFHLPGFFFRHLLFRFPASLQDENDDHYRHNDDDCDDEDPEIGEDAIES